MALGDGVSGVVGHAGIGQAVGRRLDSSLDGSGNIASLDLGGGGVCDSGVRGNLGGRSLTLGSRGFVIGSLILLSQRLDLGDCTLLGKT
jgi:hypothetical protein